MKINCKNCQKSFEAYQNSGKLTPFFPFCSQRCRLIDLGHWLDADYQINTDISNLSQEDDKNTDSATLD